MNDSQQMPRSSNHKFEEQYGEKLAHVLDVTTWAQGHDLSELYERLRQEAHEAATQENAIRDVIRAKVFPKIAGAERHTQIPEAGVYGVEPSQIEAVHRLVLFNGGVEAIDANVNSFDSLPLTATQIGIALVHYNGSENTWVHRFFRRDLRQRHDDLVEEATQLLERREQRGGFDQDDGLSQLVQRGVMSYVERAALLHHAQSAWRIGHGAPAPFELLTGSGDPEFLRLSLNMLRTLFTRQRRFLFIPSAPRDRVLLTLGSALNPLEYMVVDRAYEGMYRIVASNRTMGKAQDDAMAFVEEFGPQILRGVYRASLTSPAYIFYAHRDHVHEAALIALADSVLQAHRGFPMLIDLADTACRNSLGIDTLKPNIDNAFAEEGILFRYEPERYSRDRS